MFTGLTPETDLAGLMHSLHDSATVFVLCTHFCFFQLARLPCLFLHRATCAKVIFCLFHVSGFLAYPTCFACDCALSFRKRERERTRLSGKKQISHAKGVAIQHEQIGQLESEDKAGGNMQQDRFPMIVCQL